MLDAAVEGACTVGFPAAQRYPEDPLALEHISSISDRIDVAVPVELCDPRVVLAKWNLS